MARYARQAASSTNVLVVSYGVSHFCNTLRLRVIESAIYNLYP